MSSARFSLFWSFCARLTLKMPFYAVKVGRTPGIYETWYVIKYSLIRYCVGVVSFHVIVALAIVG